MYKLLFLVSILFFTFSEVKAVKSYTWEGDVDSSWNVTANWDANPTTNGANPFLITGPANYTDAPVITSTPVGFNIEDIDISGGSLLQIRGGTVVVTDDVAIRGGSDVIMTGGALTIRGNLYILDSGSSLLVDNGDIVVEGEIILGQAPAGVTAGTSGPTTITVRNGSIETDNNIIFDNATGDTHSITISGGSISVDGDISSSGEDVVLDISGTAAINIGDDLLMTGGNDDITMDAGRIIIAGDWNNQGTSNITGGSVIFSGANNSTITNPVGQEFSILSNLKSPFATIELADSIIIKNYLDFKFSVGTGGIINGNGNTVTFNDDAIYFDAENSAHINGPVNIVGNATFIFPIGDGIAFRPITLGSAPNTINDVYQAEYFGTNPDGMYPIANKEAGIVTISQLEYWRYERLVGTSNEVGLISWNAGSLVGDLADLLWVRWDVGDNEWKNEGTGGVFFGSTTASGNLFSDGAMSEFGIFTLGSTSLNNPLPVELIEFNASLERNTVKLRWSTLSEINNNHFVIERTINGKDIEARGTMSSKAENGNSTNRLNYTFEEPIDFDKIAYYRIVQVDHDGTTKEYPFVSLEYGTSNEIEKIDEITIYPNPTYSNTFRVQLSFDSEVEFRLYTIDSKEVGVTANKLSGTTYEINVQGFANKGVHFLKIIPKNDLGNIQTRKILLQ